MAIFHSTTKIIARSDGHNAVGAAAYRSGMRITCQRTGQVFNFTRKREVSHRAILAPTDSPDWVFDRAQLFNRIEASETRVNSQLCREVEVALPAELTHAEQVQLLTDYVQSQFVNMGMVADLSIHSKVGNPHAHILLTLRDINADGFGTKRRDWNDKALVTTWRQAWADACNTSLERSGHESRIDHRSNADRGILEPATIHVGRRTPANADEWDAKASFNAWIETSKELARIQSQIQKVQSQIIDLTSTIEQALAARDAAKNTTPKTIWTNLRDLRIGAIHTTGALQPSGPVSHLINRANAPKRSHPNSTPPVGTPHERTGIFKGDKPC